MLAFQCCSKMPSTSSYSLRHITRSALHTTAPAHRGTHYDTLGVPSTSTSRDIKSAFYELSKKYHPDTGGTTASANKFHEIQQAYQVIGTESSRAAYDKELGPGSGHSRSHHFNAKNDFGYTYGRAGQRVQHNRVMDFDDAAFHEFRRIFQQRTGHQYEGAGQQRASSSTYAGDTAGTKERGSTSDQVFGQQSHNLSWDLYMQARSGAPPPRGLSASQRARYTRVLMMTKKQFGGSDFDHHANSGLFTLPLIGIIVVIFGGIVMLGAINTSMAIEQQQKRAAWDRLKQEEKRARAFWLNNDAKHPYPKNEDRT